MRLAPAARAALRCWPGNVDAARRVQERLAPRVRQRDELGATRLVAGTDVGFENDGTVARAAVVVLEFPSLVPRRSTW